MSSPPEFHHQIKIEKVACPLHVIQMKKGLDQIKGGEILKVSSNDYVAPELLAVARQIASSVEINEDNEIFLSKAK